MHHEGRIKLPDSDHKNSYKERIYENKGFPALVRLIEPQYKRVLDVGCGNGANMRLLTELGHEVVGITLSEVEAMVVRSLGFDCKVCDISVQSLPFSKESFDALLFCHVLEHVVQPENVLKRYTQLLRPGGGVYVALPNVMQFGQRWQFILGRFRYRNIGLMDDTHLRFFDFITARQLLEYAGLEVTHHFGIGQFPMGPLREWTPKLSGWIDAFVSRQWPSLFAFHIVVIGKFQTSP